MGYRVQWVSGPHHPPGRHSLLSADILALHGAAQHLAHTHAQLNVLKAQTQVLTQDGEPCASLSRARLGGQLWGGKGEEAGQGCPRPGGATQGRQLGGESQPLPCRSGRSIYLENLGVCAAAAAMAGMHPRSRGVGRAVVAQGAAALGHAPATLEARVSFEAEATALSQGWALVEVGCWGWKDISQLGSPTARP